MLALFNLKKGSNKLNFASNFNNLLLVYFNTNANSVFNSRIIHVALNQEHFSVIVKRVCYSGFQHASASVLMLDAWIAYIFFVKISKLKIFQNI